MEYALLSLMASVTNNIISRRGGFFLSNTIWSHHFSMAISMHIWEHVCMGFLSMFIYSDPAETSTPTWELHITRHINIIIMTFPPSETQAAHLNKYTHLYSMYIMHISMMIKPLKTPKELKVSYLSNVNKYDTKQFGNGNWTEKTRLDMQMGWLSAILLFTTAQREQKQNNRSRGGWLGAWQTTQHTQHIS